MTTPFDVAVVAIPGGVALELAGEVDGAATEPLLAAAEQAAASSPPGAVLLDFTNVSYINSTGIALIVSVLARARAQRRVVVAAGLSEHYRQIFDITRLSDFIEVCTDRDGAARRVADAGG